MFAAKFREAAGRALLLPKRRPGGRSPLWQQRKRAADLLAVASRFGSFPIVLEAYRECLRDVFDMPALVDTLAPDGAARDPRGDRRLDRRRRRLPRRCCLATSPTTSTTATRRSPNAARRRCRSIRRSCASCSARPSCATCSTRTRLPTSRPSCSTCTTTAAARTVDGVHDLLLRLGDLSVEEIDARAQIDGRRAADELTRARRAIAVTLAGQARIIPVEYASRYRDALGVPLPPGLPEALLEPAPHAALDLARRYARTHGPFTTAEFAGALRSRTIDGRGAAQGARRRRAPARRRFPARRHGTRMVRPGRAADDPAPIAGQAAASGRTGRAGGPRTADHALAGRRPPPRGPRRAARCDRGPAGRAAHRVDSRDRDPAGAGRRLSAVAISTR